MSYLYMLTRSGFGGFFSVAVALLGSRGDTSRERPWHFFLDMEYQGGEVHEPGASKYFADGCRDVAACRRKEQFRSMAPITPPDAGTHSTPNPDFLKAELRYYLGVANPTAKGKVGGVELPTKPKWEGGKLTGEGYYVNHIPPAAVEKGRRRREPLLNRGQTQFNRHCAACHGQSGAAAAVMRLMELSAPLRVKCRTGQYHLTRRYSHNRTGQLFNTVSNGVRQMRLWPSDSRRVGPVGDCGLYPRITICEWERTGRASSLSNEYRDECKHC